jgi:hypothetical protein
MNNIPALSHILINGIIGIWPESHPAEIPSFREGDFSGPIRLCNAEGRSEDSFRVGDDKPGMCRARTARIRVVL